MSMPIPYSNKNSGFTLIELLIVVSIILIIAIVVLIAINPFAQIGKSWDARRKADLETLKKAYEDYYNDKGCYPNPNEVCYNTPVGNYTGIGAGASLTSYTCYVCGSESSSPSFAPYLKKLPCDPEYPTKNYLYQSDATNGTCPKWYKMYSNFSNLFDLDSKTLGCTIGGCGPARPPAPTFPYGYDYGISSSNTYLEISNIYNCITSDNKCNTCNSYQECMSSPGCVDKNKIYGSRQSCCSHNPGSC